MSARQDFEIHRGFSSTRFFVVDPEAGFTSEYLLVDSRRLAWRLAGGGGSAFKRDKKTDAGPAG